MQVKQSQAEETEKAEGKAKKEAEENNNAEQAKKEADDQHYTCCGRRMIGSHMLWWKLSICANHRHGRQCDSCQVDRCCCQLEQQNVSPCMRSTQERERTNVCNHDHEAADAFSRCQHEQGLVV